MNKFFKAVLALLGITLVGGVIIKERNTFNDIRKQLRELRWFEKGEGK
jgi:hypothetical protein